MTQLMIERELPFLTLLNSKPETRDSQIVSDLRRRAEESYGRLGLPTTELEEWKYTNVSPLAKLDLRLPESSRGLRKSDLGSFSLGESVMELVFVNGRYSSVLSNAGAFDSPLLIRALSSVTEESSQAIDRHLTRAADFSTHAFVALNTAMFEDGVLIVVPPGLVVDRPIHILFVTRSDVPVITNPRVLIVAEKESHVSVIETYAGLGAGGSFTNTVSEILVMESASVHHYKVQREPAGSFHIGTASFLQHRSSQVSSFVITLGSGLSRNEVNVRLEGEGADCSLDGLYLLDGRQHADNHTVVDHVVPHTSCNELYKGVLDGKSTGVFDGKIIVRKDAQKTSSQQRNHNLLLTDEATADSKPQLEIHADDVKCTHGSTIGQLEEDSLFYLQARGIGLEHARNLLTYGFASEVVEKMKVEPLREQLQKIVLDRLPSSNPEDRP